MSGEAPKRRRAKAFSTVGPYAAPRKQITLPEGPERSVIEERIKQLEERRRALERDARNRQISDDFYYTNGGQQRDAIALRENGDALTAERAKLYPTRARSGAINSGK